MAVRGELSHRTRAHPLHGTGHVWYVDSFGFVHRCTLSASANSAAVCGLSVFILVVSPPAINVLAVVSHPLERFTLSSLRVNSPLRYIP